MVRLGFRRLCSFLLYSSLDRCVCELVGTLAVGTAEPYIYLKRAGAATSPLLTGQPAVQRSARVSVWLMQPPHPCLRLSPC